MGSNLKILALAIVSLSLMACSSRPYDGKSSQASSDAVSPSPNTNSNGGSVASCNQFSGSENMIGKVQAYFDQYGVLNTNFLRLRFMAVPSNFGNSDSLFIEFHRAKVSSAGVFEEDPVALAFRMENKDTMMSASQWFNLSPSNIGYNRQALFGATSSQNVNKLLDYNFLIQGTDQLLGYQVLRAVLKTSGGAVAGYADMLMPQFYAAPYAYASTHPNMLNQLHPNWSRRDDANISDAGFLAYTRQMCLY